MLPASGRVSLGAVVIFVFGVEMWQLSRRWWGFYARAGEVAPGSIDAGEGLLSAIRSFPMARAENDLEKERGHVVAFETQSK